MNNPKHKQKATTDGGQRRDEWWGSGFDIMVTVNPEHVRLLHAMLAEGGHGIIIDAAFLNKHDIKFAPCDPRIEITDIQHFGFIRKSKSGGWDVTARAKKWLRGESRIRQGIALADMTKAFSHWLHFGIKSVDDVLKDAEVEANKANVVGAVYK
jgi:hypothetical protein